MRSVPGVLTLGLLLIAASPAQQTIDPAGVAGARILAGGGKLPDAITKRFVALAGGPEAVIALVPTASIRADSAESRQSLLQRWQERHPQAEFFVLHTRSRDEADSDAFCAPLRRTTALWFGGGQQQRLADTYVGTRFEQELMAMLGRGGVVGGSSAGAAIQTRTMIARGNPKPETSRGLDLVPLGIADQHFRQRDRQPRLLAALAAHPDHFGLGIDEGTAVEVRGRRLSVLGNNRVTLALAAGGGRPERVVELQAGQVVDLVTWQRRARDRVLPEWPPATMAPARVTKGSLMIVGGGRLTRAVIRRFVELAGGEDARVVVVTSASGQVPRPGSKAAIERALAAAGVQHLHTISCLHPSDVGPEQRQQVAEATAIWFGGGRQWRLCDAFEDTGMVEAFAAVLTRGGVIGGSSAGATIQGEFLVRGNPLGNRQEWCPGYDRGFGFLPGCAIDQHFVARNRMADLQGLIAELPQLIGLGIDEATAALVQGSTLEVLGRSKVAVYDVRDADAPDRARPEPSWLMPGDRWDLVTGQRLR
ncbi:MAG: cyanophycinase [Planctomycetota bacterium]|nr:cyanophycinase [Planctomycetota bacterium]